MDKKEKFNIRLNQAIKSRKKVYKENKNLSINYSVAMNLTIELVTGMALGFFLGIMLDNYLQTKPLMLIIFFVVGTFIGFYNMYKSLKKYGYFK